MLEGVLGCLLLVIGRPLIYKNWVLGSAFEQCIVIAFSCLISPRPGLSIYPREGTYGASQTGHLFFVSRVVYNCKVVGASRLLVPHRYTAGTAGSVSSWSFGTILAGTSLGWQLVRVGYL